jgi:hypothetical protein
LFHVKLCGLRIIGDNQQELSASGELQGRLSNVSLDDLVEHAKVILSQALGLDSGEFDMYTLEPPAIPDSTVMIVAKADALIESKERAIGYCFPTQHIAPGETSKVFQLNGTFDPRYDAIMYFPKNIENSLPFSAIQLIKEPEHGTVSPYKSTKERDSWRYLPDEGYIGNDEIEFLVDVHGIPVKVFYFIKVGPPGFSVDSEKLRGLCEGKYQWIISQPLQEDDTATNWYYTPSLQALLAATKDALAGFTDLSVAAIGQTTGDKITLDSSAASHGWFIDYTPYLDEEWLPTISHGLGGSHLMLGFASSAQAVRAKINHL